MEVSLSGTVRARLHTQNQNWLGIITGPTGSGKSYSALKLCYNIDPEFNISRVCFSIEELMALINSGTLSRGSAVMLDEAGIAASSRQWFTLSNRLFGFLLQSFRIYNLAVVFTVPSMSFVDVQLRSLVHCVVETKRIDYETKEVHAKPFFIKNTRGGRTFFVFPRFAMKEPPYSKITVNEITFSLPPEDLVNAYELRKRQFTEELNKGIAETLMKGKKKETQPETPKDPGGRPQKLTPPAYAYIAANLEKSDGELKRDIKKLLNIEVSERTISGVKSAARVKA